MSKLGESGLERNHPHLIYTYSHFILKRPRIEKIILILKDRSSLVSLVYLYKLATMMDLYCLDLEFNTQHIWHFFMKTRQFQLVRSSNCTKTCTFHTDLNLRLMLIVIGIRTAFCRFMKHSSKIGLAKLVKNVQTRYQHTHQVNHATIK